jgi:pimeloyl-ACP methyl ester carboxylesterase
MQTITGYTERHASLRGIDIHWLEWGDAGAPPMVLLHGLTGHAHIWDHMAPALAGRYSLLAPDQRGHGSSGHAGSYTTAEFVEDLAAFVAHTALPPFVLMGLSMGGHNAMAFAAAHPKLVTHVVAIDIPPKLDLRGSPGWGEMERLAEAGHKPFASFHEAVEAARAGNPTAPQENLEYRTKWNLNALPDGDLLLKYDAKAPALWAPDDLWPRLAQIKAPTLLVRGGKTLVLPRATAERMASEIRDCELVEVPESGHSVPTDCPGPLQELVLDWLTRRGA